MAIQPFHRIAADRLAATARAIDVATRWLSDDEARWRSEPSQWSAKEVIHHLYDEDREDFQTRIELTLRAPDAAWPPIDPPRWVVERAYNEQAWPALIDRFLAQRAAHVDWLRGLRAPDWERTHTHPTAGPLRAGDLLASWIAHDVLHLRQLARIHFRRGEQLVAPYSNRYAGAW